MTNSPSSQVFNNAVILGNILEHFSEDFTKHLNLRLINKSVNQVFLGLIRRNHQRTKIEVVKKYSSNWVYINYRLVPKPKIVAYLRFLNVIGTVVSEIVTKYLSELEEETGKEVHDNIHLYFIRNNQESARKLIGLEEFCRGCPKCAEMPKRCLEYGPISYKSLKSIETPKHFKELHVNDDLFDDIANYCALNSGNREEMVNNLRLSTNSNIICDELVICMNERKRNWLEEKGEYSNPRIPLEVINSMLDVWRVKTIKMRFVDPLQFIDYPINIWLDCEFFTPMQLKGLFSNSKKSDQKFDRVKIDLSNSYLCSKSFRYNSQFQRIEGYHNLIANIRRLFPSDTILFTFSHWHSLYSNEDPLFPIQGNEVLLEKLLTSIRIEKQQNLTVNVEFFTRFESLVFMNLETGIVELLEIPLEFSMKQYKIKKFVKGFPFEWEEGPEKFEIEKWSGRRLQMEDNYNNLIVNVDFFVERNKRNWRIPDWLLYAHPNSLVKFII